MCVFLLVRVRTNSGSPAPTRPERRGAGQEPCLGAILSVGSWPGAPRAPLRAELRTGCCTRRPRSHCAPAGARGPPTFPALGTEARALLLRAGTQPPAGGPGRALGLTRSLGVLGASPRPAPGHAGSESGRLP